MSRSAPAISVALMAALTLAGSARGAELIIDNWNVTTGDLVTSSFPCAHCVVKEPRDSAGGTSLVRREIFANVTAGTSVTTVDSVPWQQGAFISGSPSSIGHGWWSWKPPSSGLSNYESIRLEFSTNVAGADIVVGFYTNDGTPPFPEIWWKDLPNTSGRMTTLSAPLPSGLQNFDEIALDVLGVAGPYDNPGLGNGRLFGASAPGLNFRVDNLIASSSLSYWQESGDAGGLDAPQAVTSLAFGISGTIGGDDAVDVYAISWSDPSQMWVRMSFGGSDPLYLSLFDPLDLSSPVIDDLELDANEWHDLGWVGAGDYLLKLRTTAAADPEYTLELLRTVQVPEPATLSLLGLGLAGLAATRRRKQ